MESISDNWVRLDPRNPTILEGYDGLELGLRITPEEVVEAYRETGLIPVDGQLYSVQLGASGELLAQGCGVGVIAVHGGVLPTPEEVLEGQLCEAGYSDLYPIYGVAYIGAYAHAFDVTWRCLEGEGRSIIVDSHPEERVMQATLDGIRGALAAIGVRTERAVEKERVLA